MLRKCNDAIILNLNWVCIGRLVAIKYLRDTASQTQLEVEILHKLSSHPNIISLLGMLKTDSGDNVWCLNSWEGEV